MPLVNCSACGRQISTEAESCPQCGHPNRAASPPVPTELRCYACSAQATTRRQSCGALSCALHLQSIYVSHGRGGAYELRCESCYSSAAAWQVFGWVMAGIAILIVLIVFFWMKSAFDKEQNHWPFWNEAGLPPDVGRPVRPPDPRDAHEPSVNPKPEVRLPERGKTIQALSGTCTVVLLGLPPGQSPFLVAAALVPKSAPRQGLSMVMLPGPPRMIPGGPGRPPQHDPGLSQVGSHGDKHEATVSVAVVVEGVGLARGPGLTGTAAAAAHSFGWAKRAGSAGGLRRLS